MTILKNGDKELLDRIMVDRKRYSIRVDNDVVWIQDNSLSEEDDKYWTSFYDYGYEFIVSLFEYLGFDSDFV